MTTVKEAVAARFVELMKERGIKTNELANRSGVTPSSVYIQSCIFLNESWSILIPTC